MPEIRTQTDISAPRARVWDVLTDFARYGEWNPLIPRIRGELEPGADVDFQILLAGRPLPIQARMLAVDIGRDFRWRGPRGVVSKLATGEHYFTLEDLSEGRTRLVHGEIFTGPVAGLLWGEAEGRLQGGYRMMNAAVRRRSES